MSYNIQFDYIKIANSYHAHCRTVAQWCKTEPCSFRSTFESEGGHIQFLWKRFLFSKIHHTCRQQRFSLRCERGNARVRTRDSQISVRSSFPLHYDSCDNHENRISKYKKNYCSKTWLSHFRRARWSVFDDTLGLYQTAVNFYQHTFSTSRVLLCNSIGTPDLFHLSAIWIWRGPWNGKFSAPSSPRANWKTVFTRQK